MPTPPVLTSATVGQKLTAAFWNSQVVAVESFLLTPPMAVLRQTVAQGMTASFVDIIFDTEDYDQGAGHATGSTGFVCVYAGWYDVEYSVAFASNASVTTVCSARLARTPSGGAQVPVNGSQRDTFSTSSTTVVCVGGSKLVQLAVGDALTCQGYAGANRNTSVTTSAQSMMDVRYVSE